MTIRFPFQISVLVLAAVLLLNGPARAADAFVTGFEDLPLMAGLLMSEDDAVSFDSPTGRIVDATAHSLTEGVAQALAEAAKARAFYKATLPQLGWTARPDGSYEREGESLKIETESTKGRLNVRFYMTPQ